MIAERHQAQVRISGTVLALLIGLNPEYGRILRIVPQDSQDVATDTVRAVIEHPDLPVIFEGMVPMFVDLLVTVDAHGKPTATIGPWR